MLVVVRRRPSAAHAVLSVLIGLALVAFWTLIALAAAMSPDGPIWLIWLAAWGALLSAAGTAAAVTAALTRPPGPQYVPPLVNVSRYRVTWAADEPRDHMTMHFPAPDRPSGQRPGPGVYQCPVAPGKPRTVRDLRRHQPPRDLSNWT